jgi:hypothetical protein
VKVIDRAFDALMGLPCWGVQWDAQLGLSFSFGAPSLNIRHPYTSSARSPRVQRHARYRNVTVRGAWWMWTWCGRWRLRLADDAHTVTAATSKRRREEALGLLDGQRLIGAGVDPVNGATELLFDCGAALRLSDSVARTARSGRCICPASEC